MDNSCFGVFKWIFEVFSMPAAAVYIGCRAVKSVQYTVNEVDVFKRGQTTMRIEEGGIYFTRRGNIVKDLQYNRHGDDEPENFTGIMTYSSGEINCSNWREDGIYLADGFIRAGTGDADIIGWINHIDAGESYERFEAYRVLPDGREISAHTSTLDGPITYQTPDGDITACKLLAIALREYTGRSARSD